MTTSVLDGSSGSHKAEALAAEHPALVTLARLGWVAKGVIYTLLGVLAIPLAAQALGSDSAGRGDEEVSQSGAVAELAEKSYGSALLWLIAIGLALYVLWRLVSIVLPAENSLKAWVTRGGYLLSALIYAALAWSALSFARSDSSGQGTTESEDSKVERYTRDIMERTGGRWIIGIIGVAVIGIGAYFVVRGVKAKFRRELEPGGVGPFSQNAIITLGRIGWIGRGIMMALIGLFLTRAAIRFEPESASGIDGALREATDSTLGALLVAVVAVALVVYGAFCIISAPRARLVGAD